MGRQTLVSELTLSIAQTIIAEALSHARRKEFGIQNRHVRVEDGIVHWSDTLKLEAKPMIGVIGVAPVAGGVLTID